MQVAVTVDQPLPDSTGSSAAQMPATVPTVSVHPSHSAMSSDIRPDKSRYPHCIVWTPIPLLTWLCPLIGHMGIAYTNGIIRDFAGPYYVSEDDMAFGQPTKYWQLPIERVLGDKQREGYDRAVYEASEIYKGRMHNLCCDNCHSHVAEALNIMSYDSYSAWTMISVWFQFCLHSRYVSIPRFIKTWLPFFIWASAVIVVTTVLKTTT